MSTKTTTADSGDDIVEMRNLLNTDNDLEQGNRTSGKAARVISSSKKMDGFLERLMLPIEERCNLKILVRIWGPRFEFIVRLMLVATYLDDSLRTATHFSELTKQIVGEEGSLSWLAATSPGLAGVVAVVALGIGLVAQLFGSLCLLSLHHPDGATKALICWTIAQPVLCGQLTNVEFIAESLSIIGGLLLLRAHLVFEQARHGTGARMQLLGRLLIPAMYLYYAGLFLMSAFALDETNSLAMYVSSLSMFVVNLAVLVGLAIGSTLVAFGLKSRLVALLLALVNLCFVFIQHPFFRFVWLESGEWKYDEDNMSMPNVVLPTDVDFDTTQFYESVYDLHKYYFFMGLSTSGALLLLAQFGPGEIAVQKSEVLLPVVRAQD